MFKEPFESIHSKLMSVQFNADGKTVFMKINILKIF